MPAVVVSRSRHFPQLPSVLWRVFATPELYASVDVRVELVSSTGQPGAVGSSCTLRFGRTPTTMELQVVGSTAPHRLEQAIRARGRDAGTQVAELAAEGPGPA